MDMWHVFFAAAAGAGWGLAVGWRNARDVALGKISPPSPRDPSQPNARALIPLTGKQREELTR